MKRAASQTDGQTSLSKAPRHRWCSRNTQNGAAQPPSPLAPPTKPLQLSSSDKVQGGDATDGRGPEGGWFRQ